MVARLLLAESGHYILLVNKADETMTDAERDEVLRLWQGRQHSGQTAAHEQSDIAHNNANGSKLQFAAETALKEPYVTEPKDVTEDERIRDKVKLTTNVSEDEPPIQVLKSDTFDAECIDREQEY